MKNCQMEKKYLYDCNELYIILLICGHKKFSSSLLQVVNSWIENQDNVCSEISGGPSKRTSCKDAPTRLTGDIKTYRLVKFHRKKSFHRNVVKFPKIVTKGRFLYA